ncbi:MAG: VIT1/CCC1 transporter family protein [Nitrososphaerota archaeon]|nr:VIT1/CCC1 transporter family protein [Nitrososphaerota archaeon]MDG7020174.1 VIT1/CCC1 transporter family protein [Nitrososphaerota archaeon]
MDRVVLGGSDGAIEGLAMTAALNGAGVPFGTIALAGLAFALAGAISMFFSNYLSRRSELDSLEIDINREMMEIETEPDEERREMVDLLRKDGYGDAEVEVIMRRLVRNKELWLKEMLRRELRVNVEDARTGVFSRPAAAGAAFLLLALLAVVPYTLQVARIDALLGSVASSLFALFVLGSKAFVPGSFRPASGLESALVGAVAGILLYLIGLLVSVI